MVMLLCFYLVIGMNTVFSVSASLKKAIAENMTGDMIIASSKAKRIDVITKDGEKEIVPLENWELLLDFIRSCPEVANASPRLRVWAFVQSEKNDIPMIITGIDPASEPGLLPNRKLEEGRWITSANEIEMYYRHSDYLSAFLNDTLGITVFTVDGYPNYDNATLTGIFDYEDLAFYTEFAFYGFVTLDFLTQLQTRKEKIASEIFIRLKDKNKVTQLQRKIETKYPGFYRFIQPQDSANLTSGVYKLTFFTVYFVAILLMIMVYLCSSFLVNISIETRRQEIGIYQALGVKKWRISLLFGGEFLVVMIISGIAGVLLGLYMMQGISTYGIEATIIPLMLVFGRSILYITNDPMTFLVIGVILFLAFIGSTLNAILRLSKLDPVEIMHEL